MTKLQNIISNVKIFTLNGNDRESVFKLIDSYIKFCDCKLIPPNAYVGSSPNYQPILNFHISGFKDIMTIL